MLIISSVLIGSIICQYCDLKSCRGKTHIACQFNGTWAPKCPENAKIIDLPKTLKTYIVTTHNGWRNKIALGTQKGFKAAIQMATMKWDEELAKLASYNVKQCVMKHDACRNTEKLKFVGQNLARRATTLPFGDVKEFINKSISEMWYGEIKYAKQADIDKCCRKYNKTEQTVDHFLQIVNESSTRVGCAYAEYTVNNIFNTTLFACNYSRTLIRGQPIYRKGKKVSGCKTGRNPKYYGLCSVNEKIDPNTIYIL